MSEAEVSYFRGHQKSPRRLAKIQLAAPQPQVSDSLGLKWNLETYISNRFPPVDAVCVPVGWKAWGNSLGSLHEGRNPIIQAPAPGLNHPPQRPHLQTVTLVLGFQCVHVRDADPENTAPSFKTQPTASSRKARMERTPLCQVCPSSECMWPGGDLMEVFAHRVLLTPVVPEMQRL